MSEATKIDGKGEFDLEYDLLALSRQSRDLIMLTIRCFCAHMFYLNSVVISQMCMPSSRKIRNFNKINKIDVGEEFKEENMIHGEIEEEGDKNYYSEVLMELDSTKRELYNAIELYESMINLIFD
jgi:hypothetical protein